MRQARCGDVSAGIGGALLLWLLLAADVAFIALHLWASAARPDYRLLSIAADNSYSELFQYLKFFWLAGLMAFLGWQRRTPGYLAWASLFVYLLLDDMLRFHEDGGAALAQAWDLPALFGMRASDLGELVISAVVALILLPALICAWLSNRADLRHLTRRLAALMVLLALLGVGLDLLTSALHLTGHARLALVTLEDGGEMIVASLMLAAAFAGAGAGLPASRDASIRDPEAAEGAPAA